jgi:hypothetical protein
MVSTDNGGNSDSITVLGGDAESTIIFARWMRHQDQVCTDETIDPVAEEKNYKIIY